MLLNHDISRFVACYLACHDPLTRQHLITEILSIVSMNDWQYELIKLMPTERMVSTNVTCVFSIPQLVLLLI